MPSATWYPVRPCTSSSHITPTHKVTLQNTMPEPKVMATIASVLSAPGTGWVQLFMVLVVSCVSLSLVLGRRSKKKNGKGTRLPPGPPGWPVVGNLIQIQQAGKPFMCMVQELRERYGPVFMLRMGQHPLIVICSAELAHEALIQKGQVFASRPPETPTRNVFSSNKCTVNSAEYGAVWRSLRKNLVMEMLNPSRVKDFRWVREWAIGRLLERLRKEADANGGVVGVLANCRFAVFCILLSMCFGSQLDEDVIERVDATLKEVLMTLEPRLDDFFPVLSPFFAKQRRHVREVREMQMTNILPLVKNRRLELDAGRCASVAYIDSLFELRLAGGRKLTDEELVTLCSEFLNGGTDTTAAALEWAMAHLVLDGRIQEKLYEEIATVAGNGNVDEGDVEKLPYLNAVVKETLRRHPPTHFVLSHAVTEPAELGGYDIPTDATVEFYTAGIGNDPAIWTDPLEFRPERFLKDDVDVDVDVDITGVKKIKMMPFGAGRRICPGLGVGTLHINLIVARMVQEFKWLPNPKVTVDMEEKYAFTVIMKNPLHASIQARIPPQ